jgi:hypothetical protein
LCRELPLTSDETVVAALDAEGRSNLADFAADSSEPAAPAFARMPGDNKKMELDFYE